MVPDVSTERTAFETSVTTNRATDCLIQEDPNPLSHHPAVETLNLAKITKLKNVVGHVRKTLTAITECSNASREINNSDSNL